MLNPKTGMQVLTDMHEVNIEDFDSWYEKYYQAVFANILKFIHQPQVAEDILQEVFISLWVNRSKIDVSRDVGGWLFVVSYNKSIAYLKKCVQEKICYFENITDIIIKEEPSETGETRELQLDILEEAVNALSPCKKRVFKLCRLQGKTYAEAAGILGVSPETIKDYMKDSLKFIREFMLSKYSNASPATILLLSFYLQS